MGSRHSRQLYRCADVAQVRAAQQPNVDALRQLEPSTPWSSGSTLLSEWPDLTGDSSPEVERWRRWLQAVWSVDAVVEAIDAASPSLARQVRAACAGKDMNAPRVRRAALAVTKYLLRMTSRATPFGLFAGVASASFGQELAVRWGAAHRAIAQVDAAWLAELEADPELLERLLLVTNDQSFVRGQRLVVPYPTQSRVGQPRPMSEVSVRHTPAVRIVVEAARSRIRGDELADKLAAEFPMASRSTIIAWLAELIERRVLLSSLHIQSTVPDPLDRLIAELETAGADSRRLAERISELRDIASALKFHRQASVVAPANRRALRESVSEQMAAIRTTPRPPLAIDLRLDCHLTLPRQVAREAEMAASALARLSPHPFGTPAWQSYHKRFFERYGVGALVPLLDVVNPDIGIGFPAGYLGGEPEPPRALSVRDQRLLAIAQAAALDGRDEVALDDDMIASLAVAEPEPVRWPPHFELCFQLQASSNLALDRGEFALSVVSASRGAGTMSGRFTQLLEPADQARTADLLANLPSTDPDALLVQLSFPPLSMGDSHVARAPQLLPLMISLGEHHEPSQSILEPTDLAVGCNSQRLYLVSLSRRRRLEPLVFHALDLRSHAPPLARFLAEIGRAQTAMVTGFDWGAAANLPFLPRLRYHRSIVSPARWLLSRADLPGADASWQRWRNEFEACRVRRRLPDQVYLTERDQRLRLHLDEPGHLAVLREHLGAAEQAILTEAPSAAQHGWFDGRAHEIVTVMTVAPSVRAAPTAEWPMPSSVHPFQVLGRDHGHLPGASRWLYAKLYCDTERQNEILADHLPALLAQWSEHDNQPAWWFIRYRDPEPHLRLRIALTDPGEFGFAAQRVGTWAGDLRRAGLLRDLQFATSYPETGRWGSGSLMAAAEEVFGADCRAIVTQFVLASKGPSASSQVLTAANFVAIAIGFIGGVEPGMAWLIDHARIATAAALPVNRSTLVEAVRLADPSHDWAALRAAPGGQALYEAWRRRDRALRAYRRLLQSTPSAATATREGIDPDTVLDSLLHAHHIRAIGIDRDHERICLRLARAAALAWRARRNDRGCHRHPSAPGGTK